MSEQLEFARILAEADEQVRLARDRHRDRVQIWFDRLPVADKQCLADWFATSAWDTHSALAAAAGDWRLNAAHEHRR